MAENALSSGFRGLIWVPSSEQEVVFLFGLLLDHLPWPIAIDEIRCAYPDCLAHRTDKDVPMRIEFELYGSNFRDHGHDPVGCDVVVCWEDDLRDWPSHIQIVELSRIVREHHPGLILRDRPKRLRQRWGEDSFHAVADPRVSDFVRQLEAKLGTGTVLHIPYDGAGADATCKIVLRGFAPGILWIWADGRYQWCWECFRDHHPEVIRLFQQLVGSTNKSSFGKLRPQDILKESVDRMVEVLSQVAGAVEARSGVN